MKQKVADLDESYFEKELRKKKKKSTRTKEKEKKEKRKNRLAILGSHILSNSSSSLRLVSVGTFHLAIAACGGSV